MRFELDVNHRNITDEEYIDDIRVVARKLKKNSITTMEYSKQGGKYHHSSIIRRFKGWGEALIRAGLTVQHFNAGVNLEDSLNDLKDVAKRLEKTTVTQSEYRQHGRWSPNPLIRHFGSWMAALKAAELRPSRVLGVTEEDLFKNLEHMWRSLGRQPRYGEVAKPFSVYSAGTYEKRFGSWRKALETFVAFMNSPQPEAPVASTEDDTTPDRTPMRRKTPRSVNWRLRFLVMKRDHFRCKLCGASSTPSVELQVDHIIPYSKSGETVFENLQTLCDRCNIGKSDLPMSTG